MRNEDYEQLLVSIARSTIEFNIISFLSSKMKVFVPMKKRMLLVIH